MSHHQVSTTRCSQTVSLNVWVIGWKWWPLSPPYTHSVFHAFIGWTWCVRIKMLFFVILIITTSVLFQISWLCNHFTHAVVFIIRVSWQNKVSHINDLLAGHRRPRVLKSAFPCFCHWMWKDLGHVNTLKLTPNFMTFALKSTIHAIFPGPTKVWFTLCKIPMKI